MGGMSMGEHVCAVVDYGWIIEGRVMSRSGGVIRMEDASVVRRWINGLGIGAIADPDHKDEYKRDPIGVVSIYVSRVLFEIPLRW
jgi:hypothetical protein